MEATHQTTQLIVLLMAIFFHESHQACTSPTTACDCFDSDGKLQIICRDKQLTAIPTFTQTATTYDEITFGSSQLTGCPNCNKITLVPDNAFANLRVKKIVLTQNAISTYSANAFSGLETILEGLELEGNGTNAAPYQVISTLTNLKQLHFEHFAQQSITSSNSPTSFPQLQQLTFKNIKELTSIGYDAFRTNSNQTKFPILSTFHLIDIITLTFLPVAPILTLTQLTELEISGTGIQQIYPGSFEKLSRLINLHITYNSYLQDIQSGAFNGIYNTLEFLYLGHNKLSNLNSLGAGSWTKLTQLNLQYNPIVTIPASTFNTIGQNLAYLSLDSCQLTSISSSMFDGLRNLHTLVLTNNKIQSVPAAVFQNSPGLTELRLDKQQNPIALNVDSFSGIENSLNHLFLGHNTLNVATFWVSIEKFPNLLELSAPSVNLQSVPDKAFRNNNKITFLDLDNNTITDLEEGSFYPLKDFLNSLTLSSNHISSISKCVFSNFKELKHLYLQDNPLVCDCRLRWLYDWVHSQVDPFKASFLVGVCSSPPALADKYFHEINSRNNLSCDTSYVEPVCTDLYATTTTTSTPITPRIIVTISFGQITHNSVNVMWTLSHKTGITGYVLETRESNQPNQTIHRDSTSQTISNLQSDRRYTFCLYLEINNVVDHQYTTCSSRETVPLTIPVISLGLGVTTETSINIFWTVTDKTDVSGYIIDIFKNGQPFQEDVLIHKDKVSETIPNLEPNTHYTFCLYFKLNGVPYPQYQNCKNQKTLEPTMSTTTVSTTPQPDSNIGIIVGATVSGVALIAIIIVIVVMLVRVKKPPKKPPPTIPISFIPAPSGSLPQAGGTAKRFSKPKAEDGAVGVDDKHVAIISNGGLDRFSAGSYQMLHEKDFHRPGSSVSAGSASTGHYVNDLSVERPLPKTPYGIPDSKGAKSRGYVNTGFAGSANPLPKSDNTYTEIDASKVDQKNQSSYEEYV